MANDYFLGHVPVDKIAKRYHVATGAVYTKVESVAAYIRCSNRYGELRLPDGYSLVAPTYSAMRIAHLAISTYQKTGTMKLARSDILAYVPGLRSKEDLYKTVQNLKSVFITHNGMRFDLFDAVSFSNGTLEFKLSSQSLFRGTEEIMGKQQIHIRDLARLIKGKRVKDTTTNTEGVAVCIIIFLYGCVRIGISYTGGAFGRSHGHSQTEDLIFLDGDIDLSDMDIICDCSEILGMLCEDKVSGFIGEADQIVIEAGTEDQVYLQPKAIKGDSELPQRKAFDLARLKIIEPVVEPEEVQEPDRGLGCVIEREYRSEREMVNVLFLRRG